MVGYVPRMSTLNKPLSRTENKALRMLAHGISYAQVSERLKLAFGYVHTLAFNIRQKTGIKNTKDKEECVAWFQGITDYVRTKNTGPTPSQLDVMGLLVNGKTYPEIARIMEISQQTAQNHAATGCRRAGIIGKGHYRTTAIAQYLASLPTSASPDGATPSPTVPDDF